MTNENADVQSFFIGYESANATFDVQQIAAFYADVFMFGGPEGVQCVKGGLRQSASSTQRILSVARIGLLERRLS